MNDLAHIPIGIAAAVGIALIVSALAAFLGRGGDAPTGPRWGLAIGLALGYGVGHAFVREWLKGPRLQEAWSALKVWKFGEGEFPLFPSGMVDWIPWLAGAALIIGVLDGIQPVPGWAKWENRLFLTVLTLGLLLPLFLNGTWEFVQGAKWAGGLGLAVLAFWAVIDARATRIGASMPLILLLMAIALSISQTVSGLSIKMGSLGGVLSGALGGIWVVSWMSPRIALARAAVPVFVVIYAGSIFCGVFYHELPMASAIALALAPMATLVDRIGPVTRLSPWKVAAIRTAALIVPLGVAVAVAYANRPPEVSSEGYGRSSPQKATNLKCMIT